MIAIRSPSSRAVRDPFFVFRCALVLAPIVIGSGSVTGQTFECGTARAADEVAICHEPGLTKLDQDLSALRHQRNQAKGDDVENIGPSSRDSAPVYSRISRDYSD